jgi:hypothetical protein
LRADLEGQPLSDFDLGEHHVHRVGGGEPETLQNSLGALQAAGRHARADNRGGCFARNLAWWRTRRNPTAKEAAQRLGVAASMWSQWESRKRVPSVAYLALIATVLEVPACMLLSENLPACSACLGHPLQTLPAAGVHAA